MERIVIVLTTCLVLASGCAEVEPTSEDGSQASGSQAGTSQAGSGQAGSGQAGSSQSSSGESGGAPSASAGSAAGESGAPSAQAGAEAIDVDAGSGRLPEPCYEPLDCERGDCSDYAPMEPLCEGPPLWGRKRYDGVCGAYRYRFDGDSFSGTITYWDLATGKLVASLTFTDNPYPCMRRVAGDRTAFEQCDEPWLDDTCRELTDAGMASD
jgi:hypothetical protein